MWTSLSSKDNMIAEMFKVALELDEPWKLTHLEYRIIGMSFLNGKVIYAQDETGTFICLLPGLSGKAFAFHRNRLVMHSLYRTGWHLQHERTMRCRRTQSLLGCPFSKEMAVPPFRSDKCIAPNKTECTGRAIQPNERDNENHFFLSVTNSDYDENVLEATKVLPATAETTATPDSGVSRAKSYFNSNTETYSY